MPVVSRKVLVLTALVLVFGLLVEWVIQIWFVRGLAISAFSQQTLLIRFFLFHTALFFVVFFTLYLLLRKAFQPLSFFISQFHPKNTSPLPASGVKSSFTDEWVILEKSLNFRLGEFRQLEEKLDIQSEDYQRALNHEEMGKALASLSHDLRSPLSAIVTQAAYLEEKIPDGNPWREEIEGILVSAGKGLSLVNDLKIFTAGVVLHREKKDLCVLVEKTLTLFPFERIEWSKEKKDLFVSVDSSLMQRALVNCIQNAIEHSKEKVKIEAAGDRDLLCVSICDKGKGMTPEQLRKARLPFYTQREHGSGLGLWITDKVMEAHGGKLEIESGIGKGTRVRLFLPRFRSQL